MEQDARSGRSGRAVRFGVYELDLTTGELRRNGLRVNLQDQPFQVLRLLMDRPGEVVEREELQKQIWPADTFVDFDLGLNTAIKKIRETLGDSPKNPKFIETFPKRGYRFIAAVEEITRNVAGPPATGQTPAMDGGQIGEAVSLPPASASAGRRNRRNMHRRIWLAAAVMVMAVTGLSLRQLRSSTHHAAAISFCLKGLSYINDAYDMPAKNSRAIEAFEQAVRLDRYYAPAHAGLGEAYFLNFAATQDEQWAEKAEAACNDSLRLDGALPAAFNCLGTVHRGRGRYDEAIEDFSKAIKIDSGNAASFGGRAAAYQARNSEKDLHNAEQDYLQAIALAPNNWHAYTSLAAFYHVQGRDCEAVAQFQKAIALRPDNSEPMASLGALYIEMGAYAEAIATLEKAIRLSPSFAAYENLGTAYLDRHDFTRAVDDFKKALDLRIRTTDPDDYVGHGNLARAFSWARKPELARQEYERAIALAKQQLQVNPKDLDANLSLAIYYAMLGQRDEARNQLDLALTLEPASPETKFWAMVIELELGNKEKAMAWLPDALRYSPPEVQAAPELDGLHRDPTFQREFRKAADRTPLKLPAKLAISKTRKERHP